MYAWCLYDVLCHKYICITSQDIKIYHSNIVWLFMGQVKYTWALHLAYISAWLYIWKLNKHSQNFNSLVQLTCGNYMCTVVWLQFGNDCVLECVCCSWVVYEKGKYGSKGALLPAYNTTSTKSSTMADQLTDLPDMFQSGEDVLPVNKQMSLFLNWQKGKGT